MITEEQGVLLLALTHGREDLDDAVEAAVVDDLHALKLVEWVGANVDAMGAKVTDAGVEALRDWIGPSTPGAKCPICNESHCPRESLPACGCGKAHVEWASRAGRHVPGKRCADCRFQGRSE